MEEFAAPDAVLGRALKTITRYSMFARGERMGVAVSGGADSIALLHILNELAGPLELSLRVLHLNHGLRGEESDGDERFVEEAAARLGLPLIAERAPKLTGNLEQAGRQARREFYLRAMRQHGLHRVALGHTRDDQAETVILRLLRGSGGAGLAGILPTTGEGFVRPLLDLTRCELEAWLSAKGISWRQDSTNTDPRFARNRLRHGILPQLVRDFNPNLLETLARTAEIARQEENYFQRAVAETGLIGRRPPAVIIDVRKLGELHPALQRQLLRAAFIAVKGDRRRISLSHLEEILALAAAATGSGRLQLPGLDVRRSFHWLRISPPLQPPEPLSLTVSLPARVAIPPLGISLHLEQRDASGSGYNETGTDLDWDCISGPLRLRSWTPGDAFQPAGESAARSVKDLFQKAKVPLWDRPHWPIMSVGNSIVWVRGFPPAAGSLAGPGTRRILRIKEIAETHGSGEAK